MGSNTISMHKRNVLGAYGDTSWFKVRLSNRIAINFATVIGIMLLFFMYFDALISNFVEWMAQRSSRCTGFDLSF